MKCARWQARLAAVLLVVLGANVGLAYDKVGELGDRRLIEVQGAELFEADRLVPQVFTDLAVIKASHPEAPLDEYREALRKGALRALGRHGFPDAAVEVHCLRDQRRVVIELNEGSQFTRGTINVTGAKQCQADWIVKRLTEGAPGASATKVKFADRRGQTGIHWTNHEGKNVDADGPTWRVGEPLRWDKDSHENLVKIANSALADNGYRDARCDVTLELDKQRCEALLLVTIQSEGEPTVIRDVVLEGNEKNSRDEVLSYLEFQTGVLLSRSELARLQRKLWDSGRFIKYTVAADEPIADCKATLRITIKEYASAPKLHEPLSAEESALLKCRQWMTEFDERREDLEVNFGNEEWGGVVMISPEQGWVIEQHRIVDRKVQPERSLYLSDDNLTLVEWDARQRITVPMGSSLQIKSSIDVEPLLEDGKSINLKTGLGWKHSTDPHEPFDLQFFLPPIVALSMAHEKDAKCTFDGNILSIEQTDGIHLRIDSSTGQLLECRATSDEGFMSVAFRTGAFLARKNEHERHVAKFANMYNPRRPVSSLLAFLCEDKFVAEALTAYGKSPRAPQVVQKLLDGRVLNPLDEFLTEPNRLLADFLIEDHEANAGLGLSAMGWRALFSYNDELFARRTWPWSLCREVTSVVLKDPRNTLSEVRHICEAADTGPIGYLLWCEFVHKINPKISRLVATFGIARLSDESFHHEFAVLLERPSLARDMVLNLAGVLKSMDDEEVEVLGNIFSSSARSQLLEISRSLRDHGDQPIAAALQVALDKLWRERWREPVRGRLSELAKDPTGQKTQ